MSNLLEKASIVLTPTAYSDGDLHCIKPNTATGDFDFTRGSSATRVNSQGLIEDVQILSGELVQNGDFEQIGSELVTNGDFATDSDWNFGTNWTISGGIASCDGSQSATTNFSQSNVISDQSKIYRVEFTLSNYAAGSVRSKISNTAQGVNRTANGTYVDILSGMTNNGLNFTANSDFIGSIDNVSVKEVGQNWTFGTGWSMGDNKAVYDGVATSLLQSDYSMTASKKYRTTIQVVDTSGSGNCRFAIKEDNNTAIGFTTYAEGTITLEFTSPTTGLFGIQASSSEGSFDITNISVIEITDDTNLPRINYLGGTGHILLEPQSTNYSGNSEQPSTWHSSGNVTITANATTSPEGTSNASLVVANTSSGSRYARNSFSFPSGSGLHTVTTSCFIKYYNNQWIRLRSVFFTGSAANGKSSFFDIQNGVLGTVDASHTAKIENYGDGWYRCSITFDIDKDTDNNGYMHVEAMNGDNSGTFATIGQGFYAFGIQGEELSFMTSYIPTTTNNSVTRSADVCDNSGSSDLINSPEGVLYAEISALADNTTQNRITLSYNSVNYVRIAVINSQIVFSVFNNGAYQVNTNYVVSNITDFNKIAVKYKENDFALWVNGSEVRTDTIGLTSFAAPLDHLNFSNANGGNQLFKGKVKCVAVFKEALTDAELTCLTT